METSSVSLDVPYWDCFTADNLVTARASDSGASCVVRIGSKVSFAKSTWGFGGMLHLITLLIP